VWLLPPIAFVALVGLERGRARAATRCTRSDHALNLIGLAIQGAAIPFVGYTIATRVLSVQWPDLAGSLAIGWWGAFALNFVFVDFLYYWQHRLLHGVPFLWAMHQCHHASPAVNVWATARNSLPINFIFVYLLVNPALGFLCDAPSGFFTAAAVTAALDLWRHARVPVAPGVGRVLVTPWHHHLHHNPDGATANYGANLILWDRLFGTLRETRSYPETYGTPGAPAAWRQFLFPW
jgi:sterol desaturase/sphingolipid hydroxylase (fatty acid hydroxylase superfamily)